MQKTTRKKNTALSDIIYKRKMNSLQVQNSRCQLIGLKQHCQIVYNNYVASETAD